MPIPMNDPMRRRRSVLYLPASNLRAIAKARTLAADSIVFDLEDAVAPLARRDARRNLVAAFAEGGFESRETVIRTNAVESADFNADLETVAECAPHAVLLPKVSTTTSIDTFTLAAREAGLLESIASWYMIETLAGLWNLRSLLEAGTRAPNRLAALVVGTNDLAKESGVWPGDERRYLVEWLMQVVLAAKACHCVVLDGVWNDFKDLAGFEREALQGKRMGFDGKTLIHPAQIDAANRVFCASADEIAHAQRIVDAFAQPGNADAAVINLDGEMVERLHFEQASRLLAGVPERASGD